LNWLALDIGGANLKIADGLGFAESHSFPLWQRPSQLAEALRVLIAGAPPADHLAVTMTGELADCFTTKAEGVLAILDAVQAAAGGRHTRLYSVDGTLLAPEIARRFPQKVAAANWHALARFAGCIAENETALLLDIGSTTTDVVPIVHGKPAATATSDTDRLMAGELVYSGVQRSPICAVTSTVAYRGRPCPLAQEVFATTWDVYLSLGDLPSQPEATHTADGRPATPAAAVDRLARSICADRETFTAADAETVARSIQQAQAAKIGIALGQVVARLPRPPEAIVLSGLGEFLGRRVVETLRFTPRIISLNETIGPQLSLCAPAHALAVLVRES
jgi:(4-(4-[2-(gamma-L-glutamylamino)ethyl]phenoxymethyl)furan-2-yl)methanamine synthase